MSCQKVSKFRSITPIFLSRTTKSVLGRSGDCDGLFDTPLKKICAPLNRPAIAWE
jgi:hypothetical protein